MKPRSDIKPISPKVCPECGSTFMRKRFSSGVLESCFDFHKRRFCSLSCANSQGKGGVSRSRAHVNARVHIGLWCESCLGIKRLHVHHVDEDWSNNDPSNLQTLCESCHRSWHAKQRARGVKPAGRMPSC